MKLRGHDLAALAAARAGAEASEVALVVPLLLTLFFGAIEYGGLAFSMSSMQFAANVVARDVAVNRLGEAEVPARVQALLPGWMQGAVTADLNESHPDDPRQNIIRLRLEAPASEVTPLAILTRLYPWTMHAEVDVRQELPYAE